MSDQDSFAQFETPPVGRVTPAAVKSYRPARWDEAAPAGAVAHVRHRHEPGLRAIPGVTGVGIGPTRTGAEGILVYVLDRSTAERLPQNLEGIPVEAVVTGVIEAR